MSTNKAKYLIWMSAFLVGLWFAACKSTPSPSTPAPPQPQAGETQNTPPQTSSTPAESTQPESQQKSKSGQTTAPEAAPAKQSESPEKSPDSQTPSAGATESQRQKTEQGALQNGKTAQQTADAKLAKARDNLRLSQATEKRIAAELEKRKESGNASAEDIRNHEAYLERVRAMVAENRRAVSKMEKAYAEHPADPESTGKSPEVSDQQIPEEQIEDPVAELDRQLSASLTEFDGMLLKEMETIETESESKMRDLAQEAAEAAKRLKEKGVDLGTNESKSDDSESTQGEETRQGKAGDTDESGQEKGAESQQGEGDDTVAAADSAKGEGSGPKRDPGSRYSKEDDDIVARQLREAAENETDPELKEKLWKEYEEYKKNTQ
jgi:hypothetical protein